MRRTWSEETTFRSHFSLSGLCDKLSVTKPCCEPKNGKKKKLNTFKILCRKTEVKLGIEAQAFNPSTWEAAVVGTNPCEFEACLRGEKKKGKRVEN